MAVRRTQTSETVQGGGDEKVKIPGWYHVQVLHTDESTKKGVPINGFRAEFSVLDGQQEEGKTFETTFFDPDITKGEEDTGYKMSMRKQTAFLVASGLLNEKQLGTEVEYDTDWAIGRQIVLNIAPDNRDENKGKGYMQLNFDDLYHIDDPRTAELVKAKKLKLNDAAIRLLPIEQRRDTKSFDLEKLTGKKPKAHAANGASGANGANGASGHSSHANGNGASKQSQTTAKAPVNLDDI